jgi:hypothetical protein
MLLASGAPRAIVIFVILAGHNCRLGRFGPVLAPGQWRHQRVDNRVEVRSKPVTDLTT